MNILAPINDAAQLKPLIDAGADEFYFGFFEDSDTEVFGEYFELNRMSGFGRYANRFTLSEAVSLVRQIAALGKDSYVTLNSSGYTEQAIQRIQSYVWRNGKMVPEIEDEIWLARFRELIDIIRSLLVDTGLLFISINDREGAYCRVICDEVFGKQNFMAQIVRRRTKNPPCANVFSREHEYIIVFSNNSKQIHEEWNQPPISTWWDSAGTDEDAVHEVKEQLGKLKFDYPKPSTLIERCIEICQNKSARVLDVFAGSGTTAVAVENANLILAMHGGLPSCHGSGLQWYEP